MQLAGKILIVFLSTAILHGSALASPQSSSSGSASRNSAQVADSAEEKISQGDRARLDGNYPLALRLISQGIKQLENSKASAARMAAAYNYLALINSNMGHYAESKKNARKAISFGAQAKLSENIMARHRVVLANALRQQGKYIEAQGILKKVIATLKSAPNEKALLATATNNLGALYFWMGYYHQAMTFLEQGLTMRLALAGADKQNLDVANSYLDLGCTEYSLSRREKAREHLTLALAIRKKKLGPDHPETLNAMANLAAFLATRTDENDVLQSVQLLKHVVESGGKKLETHHPDFIRYQNEYSEALANQASKLSMQGQQKQALAAIELSIKLKETTCEITGRNNISYAVALANAAAVLKRLERIEESKKMLAQANKVLDGLPSRDQQSSDGKSIRHAYKLLLTSH